jgi:RNA polymerase sigma-70 factor (ECF subfamily)
MASVFTITEYESLFRQHYSFLCLVAFRIVRDQNVAEDIVQDFFLDIWQRRSEIKSIGSFQAYATRAVKNGSISFLRKQQVLSDEQLNAMPDGVNPFEEKELVISGEAMTSRVMEVVALLPEERKKIFLLYAIDRLSYAQIAEKQNVSLNTVKTQMKRAYAFIRERMANDALGLILLSILLR